MPYKIQITAPVTREATIKAKVDSATEKREFFGFRNRRSELPLIQVPLNLPVYRMENFRTFTDQKDYVSENEKNADFFSSGQESEAVQQAQHQLLHRLALKGKSDSVVPVIDVLKEDGQREPLLITSNGVVVNGNRRLAAFRELYDENGVKYSAFSHIDVLVLPPDATADEIVDIEANLQAMPETKLDYDWIGEAQLIKRLVSLGRTHSQVADQLHRNPKDIQYAIQTLAEADLYLKEAKGTTGSYSEIREDAEQLFGDLPKLIENKSESMKEASRIVAWTLFQNKDRLPGRLYDFNPAIGKLTDDILDRVSTELGLGTEQEAEAGETSSDDLFAVALDDDTNEPNYLSVINALKSDDNEEAIETLIEAAQTAIELEKGKRSGNAALKSVTQAHSKLASVDISKADPKTLPGIAKQLAAIKALVVEMEATVAKAIKS